jgi:hypothetical protein
MEDMDLNKKLDSYQVPEPGDLLKARILKTASAKAVGTPSFTRRFMPLAASLLAVCAVGLTTLQLTQTDETEAIAWQDAATDLGFDDIYDWVEAEETTAQDS